MQKIICGGMESLSKDDFKDKIHKTLYLNNLLYSYLLVGKYREARLLFSQEESLIVPEGKVGDLSLAIFSTLATYRYFFDSPESSRRLYQHLLEKEMDDRPKACILYFLARLDLLEGRTESARQMLETSRVCGSGTYIVEEINALEKGTQRIGNPGDGALVSAKI